MNEYIVYWLEEPFTRRYFKKSDILFRFLKQYEKDKERQDLLLQFKYITKIFPKDVIIELFNDYRYKHKINVHVDSQKKIDIRKENNIITLWINTNRIVFYCSSLDVAEFVLLPILREFHPYLFIANMETNEYGWISPIFSSDQFKKEQVLYSIK